MLETPMKIGLYITKILYSTGGTESYTVRMAQALVSIYPDAKIYFVTECFDKKAKPSNEEFVKKLNSKYGTHLDFKICFLSAINTQNTTNRVSQFILRKKIERSSKQFDLFFYCSRGHYVFRAKKNIAIIHFPMERLSKIKNGSNKVIRVLAHLKDKRYYKGYDLFLPNSNFTKTFLQEWWPEIPESKINLLYPPVQKIEDLHLARKNHIMVCSRIERDKNLESLIDAFKSSTFLKENYKLVIAGGSDEGSLYLPELKAYSNGANIEIRENLPFNEIVRLYNESKFFWHCKGYAVDEKKDPYKCEHFGITTVEAMSAGCIPIVINKAGQKEIVSDDCGKKWLTLQEIISITEELARDNTNIESYSEKCRERANFFLFDEFSKNLKNILETL